MWEQQHLDYDYPKPLVGQVRKQAFKQKLILQVAIENILQIYFQLL